MTPAGLLVDSQGRRLRDLRVSVTDRCNLRCLYCLPESEAGQSHIRQQGPSKPPQWLPKDQILSFEEIERVVRVGVRLGIQKVRLTGGEPLLRTNVEQLVARLAGIPDLADLAMTTNGLQFRSQAPALRAAGLRRVSFSLDTLARDSFRRITGWDGLEEVLAGIGLAQELGLQPVKVNAVIIRGLNEGEVETLADFANGRGVSLRFIEFMPLDSAHAWLKEKVVPGHEILARLQARFDLRPVAGDSPSATAKRWAFADGRGEVGIIAPVTEPFCGHCNRLRLTADGKIRTCLFSVSEHDLRSRLRDDTSDEALAEWLKGVVGQKETGHQIGEPEFVAPSRSVSRVGG